MPKLILISGPSGIGKSPLAENLCRIDRELADEIEELVLFNDRRMRPGETDGVDYHFRTRDEIERLGENPGVLLIDNRGDLQALDLAEIDRILESGCHALYEGNPGLPARLREAGILARHDSLSIFLAPLSREEIRQAKADDIDLPGLFAGIQRRKLLHRTSQEEGTLSLGDLENIETRATSAYDECRQACHFDHVVPLHDGEGNDNWDRFGLPIGSARHATRTVAALIRGEAAEGAETWEADLLP
ncbi:MULTISPECIES: guanylate kinase [Marinovum]|uniref:guanylate kinase n=1 Tax=Marinovum TaxID=367771 RepID=UPI00237C51D4|nr:hypothetical protein [Marinovum sp. PR37]MDD9745380.1 hypothetical protein [Marinovum sp. PR37]